MTANFAQIQTSILEVKGSKYRYFPLASLEEMGFSPNRLPFSIRILLESALRQRDGRLITDEHIRRLASWGDPDLYDEEIPFKPARIVLQDFTGVPSVVDLAAMRSFLQRQGGDPGLINPCVPVDLVIDHSLIVDEAGHEDAFAANIDHEFRRNGERYRFLRWAQKAFANFRVVPPGTGIVHQVNLEYLATLLREEQTEDGSILLFPDTLIGTDSHTTMINGLGIVGWGVGGIEAEACMLGQPLYMGLPEVVGLRLYGSMPIGTTATDLALKITSLLRREGVVGKFVEFFGPGVKTMSLPDRATIANMSPEYGATMGFFPFDEQSLEYLRQTGRDKQLTDNVEAYYKCQNLFYQEDMPDPEYTRVLELDLGSVGASLAGPKRPQDLIKLTDVKSSFQNDLCKSMDERGFALEKSELETEASVSIFGKEEVIRHGSIVIAAITSCTNTSNPSVMIGAGLIARKAVELGLACPAYVKTSLTPGSQVVTSYLQNTGLLQYLEKLGFNLAGYGCCTCIGNSGPLSEPVAEAIDDNDLVVASVLSGNRNFEGRIHPQVKANYLASPMLVVAYALAGKIDIDWEQQPLGKSSRGEAVYLRDIWPSEAEIAAAVNSSLSPELFRKIYDDVFTGPKIWRDLEVPEGEIYKWNADSTYIQEPPFFQKLKFAEKENQYQPFAQARVLALLGDSVTTDHISPAGSFGPESPAGKYLRQKNVLISDFNSYGSRRGNHNVMMRGTFANTRLHNYLVPGQEGGFTLKLPEEKTMPIFDAAMAYTRENKSLIILAGKEYGTGSSRDWAAKGTSLLGVSAVVAESYERIHRSNLIGMGVMPLQFVKDSGWQKLGLTGREFYSLTDVAVPLQPGDQAMLTVTGGDGKQKKIPVKIRLDNQTEIKYFLDGGILQSVLKEMVQQE